MEYIEDATLHALGFRTGERWGSSAVSRVYDQLADVYAQLRSLQFPDIGALGKPTEINEDIGLRHRPLPIEVLLQHVEGLDPAKFFPEETSKLPRSTYQPWLKLANNQLLESRDPGFADVEDAKDFLYAHRHFCDHVTKSWVQKAGNQGSFILMHGDMRLHGGNLLWDENLNLRAVIDWEWSYTVPRQCFIPPAWLNGFRPDLFRNLSLSARVYQDEVDYLCDSITERWPDSPQSREWKTICRRHNHLVVLALLYLITSATSTGTPWTPCSISTLNRGKA